MKRKLSLLAYSLLLAGQSWGASVLFDFNQDPQTSGSFTNYGNALWVAYGGVGVETNIYDGYLQITAAKASQSSAIVFQDLDNGAVVQGFTFECDLRIGNGTTDPADGFSINYARAGDPALVAADAGAAPGAWATGPNCEANLPEEGTQTGLSIGFDAWDSGGTTPFCNELAGIGKDIIGVSVRVDGTLVYQFATPTKNGDCNDPSSLQTGKRDGSNSSSVLCWAHLKVQLATNGVLNVWWKGTQILTDYQTTFFPSPGRLVFAGRTGGSYQNQEVDNIKITTVPAALALVGQPAGLPDGFSLTINDSPGTSVVDTRSLTATLNGVSAAPLTVTKNGAVTTVLFHGFPMLLPVGSTNTVVLNGRDTNGNDIGVTRTFVEGSYSTLPVTDAVASGVDTSRPGFRLLPWQSGTQPNRLYWTEEQLLGLHGANQANLSQATDGSYIDFTGLVNFNITPASNGGGDSGNFQTGGGYPDSLFPGIPGANGLNGNSAVELLTFVKFNAAGVYLMGVNSDDGFRVTEAPNPKDRFALVLGSYDGGRGSSDSLFYVAVTNAGTYPLRLIWENGNGESGNGANLEWFTVKDGVKYLLNDPSATNTTGITAYFAGPQMPAWVSHVYPYNGAQGCRADRVIAQLTDGGTTVNGASAKFYVDGAPVDTTTAKNGSVTTATANFTPATMMPAGRRTATLVWSESNGTIHSNSWSFTVVNWTMLNARLGAPLNAADLSAPGFSLEVVQIDPDIVRPGKQDGMANQIDSANAVLSGLYFPWYGTNTVDVSGFYGLAPAYGNVWYWSNSIDFNIVTSAGDFANNYSMPGIPGVTLRSDNFASAFQAYVAFPTAGYYRMSVNSDDNFRMTEGVGITRQALHIIGNGIDKDVAAVAVTTNFSTFGPSLPVVPVSGPVAYFPNTGQCPMPAVNLAGKVAVINNTTCYDREYVAWAQDNGAIGVVIINDQQWGMPYVLGGDSPDKPITVPVVCVSGFAGEEQVWATNANLVASIGADANLQISAPETVVGKGMSWVDFSFVVPQAGLYPLRLVYEQGGSGAGLEWVTVNPTSLAYDDIGRVLVNDAANAQSLKAYRSVTIPTLNLVKEAGVWKIYYSGKLLASPTANGTYQAVMGASNPYTLPTGNGPSMFYRSSN